MVLFIVGVLMLICPVVFMDELIDKFEDSEMDIGLFSIFLGCVFLLLSFGISPQVFEPNYGNYTTTQLENITVSKETMDATDINLKLVEDNKDNSEKEYYKISYKINGVNTEKKEKNKHVKAVKEDSGNTYIEKLKVKRKRPVTEWIFSMSSVTDKYATVYVVHYI